MEQGYLVMLRKDKLENNGVYFTDESSVEYVGRIFSMYRKKFDFQGSFEECKQYLIGEFHLPYEYTNSEMAKYIETNLLG